MKQGIINALVFLAVTIGPLVFWKSAFGEDLLDRGFGWTAYLAAPVVGAIFALVASKGEVKGSLFLKVFSLITVILLAIALGVNLDV